jgi:hypothetical protein
VYSIYDAIERKLPYADPQDFFPQRAVRWDDCFCGSELERIPLASSSCKKVFRHRRNISIFED